MAHITWSIGELAARAGLPVKTVRYYSDLGLLPEAPRSAGGHRRYGPTALDRLRLIRQLRALDIPLATITQVAGGERSLGEVVTGELERTRRQISRLRSHEAMLQALDDCDDETRLRRLEVLAHGRRPSGLCSHHRRWDAPLTSRTAPEDQTASGEAR